ncbi:mitochondrial uncoupling protein 4 isoform X1 [Plutella xylostella]|uniref:mitochondrial uncoupling protein 4 isoform X1 n=1 Tax=Plutella xylostella TaxID=51655 RepID=UPI002032E27B|nr:mitochondrial uncoupling protein 4 isoform X1 [Plutella xylostella]XP_048481781.1 mitochondrial uncoupling protein 4 isoform X1 [Plutella xylostella]
MTERISKENSKPQAPKTNLPTRYVVAVLSAWIAEGVTYPCDLTKTRLQIQSEVATTKSGYKLENYGMVITAKNIAKNEGIIKLWSGFAPMLQRHAIYSGCRLLLYEQYRKQMGNDNGKMSLATTCFGGMFAGGLAQFIASPTDLVKVQMQAEGRRLLQGRPPRFKNCRDAYLKLYAEGGILGFWRGAVPNVCRAALVNVGDLAAYDYTKRFLIEKQGFKDNIPLHFISAFTAGLVAAVVGNPADVMKTRLMNQPLGPDGKGLLYKGMFDCFRQSVVNEGPLALYKGFFPLWLRMGPWALVNWLAFENIMIFIGGKTF